MKRPLLVILMVLGIMACEPPPKPQEDMILIPAGEFQLGMNPSGKLPDFYSDVTSSQNAQPMQPIYLDAFLIDPREVTYQEFLEFKPAAAYAEGQSNHPIRGISWYEADAYCLWRGKRLPTEMEWEKAARGEDGRLFVWGNDFQRELANFGKVVKPVKSTETDKSVFGVYDMNGNVSEWTASWYEPYPNMDLKDDNFGHRLKVIRGGAFNKREHGFMEQFTLLPFRNVAPPELRTWNTGFRCARSLPKESSNQP